MIGIYIHIPYCKSKCAYCSFYSVAELSSAALYLDALDKEINMRSKVHDLYSAHPFHAKSLNKTRLEKIDTIYIGGGTPSVLPKGSVMRILNTVRECFNVLVDSEITVEANPESCSQDFLDECMLNGVNRISIGLQTHDNKILRAISRPHTYTDFSNAIKKIRQAGIVNVSTDLMMGLPGQSKNSLFESLKRAMDFSVVRHVSLYALTVEEGTSLYRSGFIADEDLQAEMYEDSVVLLQKAGYMRYEVSNFAQKGFESRHNQKYWNGEEYLGFGAAAHSFQCNLPDKTYRRIENPADLLLYNSVDFSAGCETVTRAERIKEIIMLSLRTVDGLNTEYLKRETGWDILTEKVAEIEQLITLNMIEIKDGRIQLQNRGFYLLSSIILKLI